MIKHIVLFKFKDADTANQPLIGLIKQELDALVHIVPSLKSIDVGLNVNPNESYHLALTTTFEDMAGLDAYAIHPEHVKVSVKIRSILEERACVDYVL